MPELDWIPFTSFVRIQGVENPNSIFEFLRLLHSELLDFTNDAAPRACINERWRGVAELSRANRAIWTGEQGSPLTSKLRRAGRRAISDETLEPQRRIKLQSRRRSI